MSENFYKKLAIKRLLFSFLLILIYLIGSSIVLPNVSSQFYADRMGNSSNISIFVSMTGLSLEKLSLFSIGLGPWLSTMILWRIFSLTKTFKLDTLTSNQAYRIKFILSLFFGVIQAMQILSKVRFFSNDKVIPTWILIVFLLSGLSIIIWIGNMNSKYGFGGLTLIFVVNLMKECSRFFTDPKNSISFKNLSIYEIGILFSVLLITLLVVFRFYQGERRLPIIHVMLEDKYFSNSYLPIPTNPAGAMPFMFASSLLMIPQSLVLLLVGRGNLYNYLQVNHILGAALFLVMTILVTYMFSYVNIDHKLIADGLKKSGDYFTNVYPGKNTERYLFDKILKLATLSSAFNVMIISVPLICSFFFTEGANLFQIIPIITITMILMDGIYIQFHKAYNRNQYKEYIDWQVLLTKL